MRVLFITSAYPTHRDDARGIFIHRLARELCRKGIQVTVIAPGAPSAPSSETMDGVEIHRAKYWIQRWQHLATDLSGIMPTLKQRPWLLFQVPPLIMSLTWCAVQRARFFDLIHAHWLYPSGIAGIIAAKVRKRPFVVTSHGGDLNLARHSRILTVIARQLSRASDACIGVSRALCEQFRSYGIPEDKSLYIPVGAEVVDNLSGGVVDGCAELREFADFAGLRILYVGSLIPRKSVETLLAAHHELEERGYSVASAIVGPGPQKDRLKSMVKEQSINNVFIVDEQPPSLIPAWMLAAHTLVLPSLSEGQPTVVMEAMALGLPVLATDIPGTQELVHAGKTGFLFPPRDVERLTGCLENFINDEPLRQQMGHQAKEEITHKGLTTPQIARKHIVLYEKLVGHKSIWSTRTTVYGPQ
jgi:glycosyltransferase involved in cell wall biosynthesis